jgi:hypothetical protein
MTSIEGLPQSPHVALMIETVDVSTTALAAMNGETGLEPSEDQPVGGLSGRIRTEAAEIGVIIRETCVEIMTPLQNLGLHEISAEFSVSVTTETGIPFVAKGSAEGTIKVTAKWQSKR